MFRAIKSIPRRVKLMSNLGSLSDRLPPHSIPMPIIHPSLQIEKGKERKRREKLYKKKHRQEFTAREKLNDKTKTASYELELCKQARELFPSTNQSGGN